MMRYALTDRIGTRATLGLIVLQTDETLEPELSRYFTAPDVAVYASRVPSGADVTPETLRAMAAEIPTAAGLLPPSLSFDAVGYGCTSGATLIGPERVARLVQGAAAARHVTNPISSVIAGLRHLGARRVGMVTPYIESVTAPVRDVLTAEGFQVAGLSSFGEAEEAKVARIDAASIIAAGQAVAAGADAVFLSCTNLRTFDLIAPLEAQIGVPVISSNQALAWNLARLAGTVTDGRVGRLMAEEAKG